MSRKNKFALSRGRVWVLHVERFKRYSLNPVLKRAIDSFSQILSGILFPVFDTREVETSFEFNKPVRKKLSLHVNFCAMPSLGTSLNDPPMLTLISMAFDWYF